MAFTEFYCQTTGSNLNAGSTTADAAVYTGVGDSDGTSIFTPSDGSTPATTVAVGDFGSVYVTVGATVAVFIGRITVVAAGVNGAVTFSTTAKSGTFPAASAGAHTITLKTGGAWQGPNAAVGFPFNFFNSGLTNSSLNTPRCNFKSGTNYSVTASITDTISNSNRVFEGYTSTPGDGGRATFDGGTSGASYNVLSLSGSVYVLRNFIFQNNGATGSATLVNVTAGTRIYIEGCVFTSSLGSGLQLGATEVVIECEAYGCNTSNTSGLGGFQKSGNSCQYIRCISHDNTGSNSAGFVDSAGAYTVDCIADTNGGHGFSVSGVSNHIYHQVVAYNNGGSGLSFPTNQALCFVSNSIFANNTAWGVTATSASGEARLENNGYFGNTSGSSTLAYSTEETGKITLASLPFIDAPNGDFRINLAGAKGAGRGTFPLSPNGYTGGPTLGYPDIGAAQHKEPARKIPTID